MNKLLEHASMYHFEFTDGSGVKMPTSADDSEQPAKQHDQSKETTFEGN